MYIYLPFALMDCTPCTPAILVLPTATSSTPTNTHNPHTPARRSCLRQDQATCLPASSPFYEITHNGLDPIIRRFVLETFLLARDVPEELSAATNSRWGALAGAETGAALESLLLDAGVQSGRQRRNDYV